MAIWEYEQCLLDVTEATSHQSEPTAGSRTNRLRAYLSEEDVQQQDHRCLVNMEGFFGISTIYGTFPPLHRNFDAIDLFYCQRALMLTYRRTSPSPETH